MTIVNNKLITIMKKLLFPFLIIISAHCIAQKAEKTAASELIKPVGIIKNLTDSALLDVVQRQTFRYFWDFGHPISGLAHERSNVAYDYGNEVVTIGGSGFWIMNSILADHRKGITHGVRVDQKI